MQPPDGPPICTALYDRPPGMPPPMSKTISRSGVPIATSTRPVRATLPESANTFVPLLDAVPIDENHAAPRSTMAGTLASVSTLLMTVGLPKRPRTAGNGGLGRGMPRRPSMLCSRAVSSPHTNAPAPCLTTMSREKPESKMFVPKMPQALACAMASLRRLMASGYSARV